MSVKTQTVFEVTLPRILRARKHWPKSVDAVIMFVVIGTDTGVWTLDLRKNSDGAVLFGTAKNPDLTVILHDSILGDIIAGTFDPAAAMANEKLGFLGSRKVFLDFLAVIAGAAPAPKTQDALPSPQGKSVSLRKIASRAHK